MYRLFAVLVLSLGIVTLVRADSVDELRRDFNATSAQLVKAINENRAAYAEEIKARQDITSRSSQELQAYSQTVQALQKQVQELQARLDASEKQNQALLAQLQKQSTDLQALIGEESKQRVAADEKIIRELTKAIATGIARGQDTPTATTASAGRTYKVARGDTLTAIGAAFKVSVARLKDANNLSSDVIQEGQVLTIPEP